MLTDADVFKTLPEGLRRIRQNINPTSRHIYMEGMLVSRPTDYTFRADAPHTYCRVCGAVFQTQRDRDSVSQVALRIEATANRKRWSHEHSATHSLQVHQELIASGRFMTPEAAIKLIPLGIIPVSDMIFDPSVEQAAHEAPRLRAETQDEMEIQRNAVL